MLKVTRMTNYILPVVSVLMVLHYIINRALFRDLWFDEALTFLNFAMLPDVGTIYRNYTIPNNQILFTILLKYWSMWAPSFLRLDFFLRLLPLAFAGGAIWMVFLWRRFFSRKTVYLIMAGLALSLPFEIYSVALRGYMPSLFLILLCANIAFHLKCRSDALGAIGYFAASLAAVAILPSNIVALGGIALCFMPVEHPKQWLRFRWWCLVAAPLLAMALFYLPILDNVRGVLALKEGWNDTGAAVLLFYASFLLSFPALIVVSRLRRRHWGEWLKIAGVVLLPLPFFLLRNPAPFPRVFFPYWGVLLLVLADGLNSFLAGVRRSRIWYPVLAALVVCCALGMQEFRQPLSGVFARGTDMDDYIYPSYARPDFQPHATVQKLIEMTGGQLPPVYVSFQADFYPMIFYGMLNGIDSGVWRFDGPRRRVETLAPGTLVILSGRPGEVEEFSKRFGVTPEYLGACGFQRIYRLP